MRLEEKIRRGLAYVFASALGSRAVSLGADIALMRLLSPREHGAMAFGMLVVGSLALLRSLGVGEALIFRRRADQSSCDTAFALSVVLGAVLYAGVFVGAPWLALLLGDADPALIAPLLRFLGALVLLQALAHIPSALLERELAFDKKLYVEALPALVYALLAVGLALGGAGVWSMVWGRLAAAAVALVAALVLSPWRLRGHFDWQRLRQLGEYGRYVSAAAIVSFLVVSIDDLLVGRLGGPAELGYYARAYLIANLPVTAIAHVAGRVAFPAYARLAGAGGDVRALYGRILFAVALVTLPLALATIVLARPFALAVLGPAWEPIVPLLQCLGGFGFLRSLLSNTGPFLNALGMPKAILKTNLLQLALLALLLYPLIGRYGALGAAVGVSLCTALSMPLLMRYMRGLCGLALRQHLLLLRPLLGPALAAALAMAALARLLAGAGEAWMLVGGGSAGLLAYAGWLRAHQRDALAQAVALLSGRGL